MEGVSAYTILHGPPAYGFDGHARLCVANWLALLVVPMLGLPVAYRRGRS